MTKTVADLLKQSSKEERGKRDGTGPYKGSVRALMNEEGERKLRGEKCPEETKEERGKRDGTGPYKGSVRALMNEEGERKLRGEKCPEETKKEAGVGSEVGGRALHTLLGALIGSSIGAGVMPDGEDTLSTLGKGAGGLTGALLGGVASRVLNSGIGNVVADEQLRRARTDEERQELKQTSNRKLLSNLLIPGAADANTRIAGSPEVNYGDRLSKLEARRNDG